LDAKIEVKEILKKWVGEKGLTFFYLFETDKDGQTIEFTGKTMTNENGDKWLKPGARFDANIEADRTETEDLEGHGQVEFVYVKRDWDKSPKKLAQGVQNGAGSPIVTQVTLSTEDLFADALERARDREVSLTDGMLSILIEVLTGNYGKDKAPAEQGSKGSGSNPFA
jgi:hypothetical protein